MTSTTTARETQVLELRAFNMVPGLAYLAADGTYVTMQVDRDHDTEEVELTSRHVVTGHIAVHTNDYNEPIYVVGASANPSDLDDDDLGVE